MFRLSISALQSCLSQALVHVAAPSYMLVSILRFDLSDAGCGTAWLSLQHAISSMKAESDEVHGLDMQAAC